MQEVAGSWSSTNEAETPEAAGPASESLLEIQNKELDAQVKEALRLKRVEVEAIALPRSADYALPSVNEVVSGCVWLAGVETEDVKLVIPPRNNPKSMQADLAFNIAKPAITASRNPVETANDIADRLRTSELLSRVETAGPFVNMELDFARFTERVFNEVETWGNTYGHSRDGEPEVVIVDFSSPNVAKNMTVAHLRSTIIGQSLVKLQAATGNIPFGINHIGDWGTQFGNIIVQYQKEMAADPEGFAARLEADPTATLMQIYRDFTEQAEEDASLADQGRAAFLRLEQGDPEYVELWSQFRQWSLRDFGPTYDRLRVKFDAIQGESFYEDRMAAAVQDGLDKGVLTVNEEGSVVFPSQPLIDPVTKEINDQIMLGQDDVPKDIVIVKPSGGTVYLTRDIAAILYRAKELGASKIVYVIGKEQNNHCLQLFNIASQLGYMALGDAVHATFGHLNIEGRKMKSRAGKVVLLNDLLDEAEVVARDMLAERQGVSAEDLTPEEAERSRAVAISSVIFNDLKQDRVRDIEFETDMKKSLEAGGVAYVQYTNSRLRSVMSKFEVPETLQTMPVLSRTERDIVLDIARLPDVIKEAAAHSSPHKLAGYLTSFCQRLNAFYNESPIGTAEDTGQKAFRLKLVQAAQQVIANSADLLHLELPERM